jgi:2-(1,2-epoxy-1,2-dihydrophenyl)acetyl-CoA isomerase
MYDFETVLVERRDRVAVITLNRPESLNRIDLIMRVEYPRALLEADADPSVSAIVVTGAGRAFCAGADLRRWQGYIDEGEPGKRVREGYEQDEEPVNEIMARIKPVVGAINGDAVGGGLTWILAADYLLAAEGARLSMRYAALGIAPQVGSSRLLPQIVGWHRAREMMLTGRFVEAEEALRIGLVAEVLPREALLPRAMAVAERFAEVPPDVTRSIKKLIEKIAWEHDPWVVRHAERETFVRLSQGPAHAESVRAFHEKRRPNFYPDG